MQQWLQLIPGEELGLCRNEWLLDAAKRWKSNIDYTVEETAEELGWVSGGAGWAVDSTEYS